MTDIGPADEEWERVQKYLDETPIGATMEIQLLSKERDQIIKLVDYKGNVLFELNQTYDELGSAGRDACADVAREFGKALGIPVKADEIFD